VTQPSNPRAICLDVGGVLLLPSPNLVAPHLAAAGVTPTPALLDQAHYRAMHATDQAGQAAPGRVPTTYWREYARACKVPVHHLDTVATALDTAFTHDFGWWRIIPGARAALAALAEHCPIALISNGDGRVEQALRDLRLAQVGLGNGIPVTAVIDSHIAGYAKPHAAIFELALDHLGVPPADAVHVGDSVLTDIRGAHQAGIPAIHLDPLDLCTDTSHQHITGITKLTSPPDQT
jgi:putative hydrolase of the HAD superfamily